MPMPTWNYKSAVVRRNNPNAAGHWEDIADWPTTFKYFSPNHSQSLTPAPVYQFGASGQPANYYYPGAAAQTPGYYYSAPTAAAAGWPYTSSYSSYSSYYSYPYSSLSSSYRYPAMYPYSQSYNYNWPYQYSQSCYSGYPGWQGWPAAAPAAPSPFAAMTPWGTSTAHQSAYAALAANAALAAQPAAPYYYVGQTAAEMQAQQAIIAQTFFPNAAAPPTSMVPFKPGDSPQFWFRDLDGGWFLKEWNDVVLGELGPGRWERHASGYMYYVAAPA